MHATHIIPWILAYIAALTLPVRMCTSHTCVCACVLCVCLWVCMHFRAVSGRFTNTRYAHAHIQTCKHAHVSTRNMCIACEQLYNHVMYQQHKGGSTAKDVCVCVYCCVGGAIRYRLNNRISSLPQISPTYKPRPSEIVTSFCRAGHMGCMRNKHVSPPRPIRPHLTPWQSAAVVIGIVVCVCGSAFLCKRVYANVFVKSNTSTKEPTKKHIAQPDNNNIMRRM